jgi:uncharacterized membrane protein YedE/YeeE
LLIGLAAALLLLLNGRISGISGIVGGMLATKSSEVGWRVVFVAGLLLGAFIYMLFACARGGGPSGWLRNPPTLRMKETIPEKPIICFLASSCCG